MSEDLAGRIRAWLDEHDACVDSDCHAEHIEALRAVLDKCEAITADIYGETFWPGVFFADEFRVVIADKLSIPTDSPARDDTTSTVAGSHPSRAGVPAEDGAR
jgi:hypothetical protein